MLRSFDWAFRSDRKILEIQSLWQAIGPYGWRAFDNDTDGIYIVARDAATNLRIKISGEAPDYCLEMHFDVAPERMDEVRDLLFRNVFGRLLLAAGATDVRLSGKPASSP